MDALIDDLPDFADMPDERFFALHDEFVRCTGYARRRHPDAHLWDRERDRRLDALGTLGIYSSTSFTVEYMKLRRREEAA